MKKELGAVRPDLGHDESHDMVKRWFLEERVEVSCGEEEEEEERESP